MNPFYRLSDSDLERARKELADKMETEVTEDYTEYLRLYRKLQDILDLIEERETEDETN